MTEKVKQFVDILDEVVTELKTRPQLVEIINTAEVIQDIASTVFINTYGKGSSAATASSRQPGVFTGILQDKKFEQKTSASGRVFKQYSIQFNGEWYSSFDPSVFSGQIFNKGDEVRVTLVRDDKKPQFINLAKLEKTENDLAPDDIPF